ncbi:MAG: hypothetical protein AB7R55_05850 [Gemmatimonadales bacterium]
MSTSIGRHLMAAAVLAAMVGCSDGTGPTDGEFDAPRVQAGLATIEQASDAPVIASFMALGRHVGASAGRVPGTGASRLVRAVGRMAGLTGPQAIALVPVMRQSAYGTTFVYDPGQDRYVAAPGRAGAPANGVRFVLYELLENDKPDPAREVGYADLVDAGAAASNSLGVTLEVVAGGVTYLSYAFDLAGSVQSSSLEVEGFLSDGANRVDFAITTTGQMFARGGTVTVDAELSVPGQDFAVSASIEGTADDTNDDGHVALSVRSASDRIDVDATTESGQLDATFTINGSLLATATGHPAEPVIRGEGGRELTPAEHEVLGHIVVFADGVFRLLGNLLEPAGALLLLALAV